METLLALQKLQLQGVNRSADQKAQIEALRRKVPESILLYFDRWIGRGKKAVAIVRGGVCCECHLRITVSILGELAMGSKIENCSNCGRLLYLPENEGMSERPAAISPKATKPPKSIKHLRLVPG
jgi:predicted  nucleic acid-binding Zn-ribbon protein